ncbi:MAG: HAD-IA family hydrolase [candidate division FCPU426 bacterium]
MKALVFDFDGLIIDSETPEYECWRQVWQQHGQTLSVENWVRCVGGSDGIRFDLELERLLGRSLDWEQIHPERIRHHESLMAGQALLPGVEDLMARASEQGWKVGVASSSSTKWVQGGLERLGLMRYVQALRTRDMVEQRKPHPEPYIKVLADLGANAALSFAFEDSEPGVLSAKAAGLTVVAVPNQLTRLQNLSAAHMILASLEDFQLPSVDRGE